MDIEIMIDCLKGKKYIPANYAWMGENNKIIDEIIKRLQMWEDFKKKYKGCNFIEHIKDVDCSNWKQLNYVMNEFEEKYLSKPKIRKSVEVEVLAENEEVIDELAKEIEDMNGQIFRKGKISVVSTRWIRD